MIYVVIPTFNRKAHLLQCLGCLRRQSVATTPIVCDSGSTDGTAAEVKAQFPDAVYLEGNPDQWWTGATNLGLTYVADRAAPEDRFLLLNDDTEFDDRYCEKLLEAPVNGPNAILGSICVDADAPEIVIDGGVRYNWLTGAHSVLNAGRRVSEFADGYCEAVSVLPGRGTLYPVAVLETVGFPDAVRLPHYAADYEYARRCALNGFGLFVSYDAVIRSDGRATGLHRPRSKWSRAGMREFFFGRRSSCNVADRFRFCFMTARNPLNGAVHFTCAVARIVYRFLTS